MVKREEFKDTVKTKGLIIKYIKALVKIRVKILKGVKKRK